MRDAKGASRAAGLIETLGRVVGWTLVQGVIYMMVFEAVKTAWGAVEGWSVDIGRGILWQVGFWLWIGLAFVGNAVLVRESIRQAPRRRLAVWLTVLLGIGLCTLPSFASTPLAVGLIWICAAVSVGVREGLGRLVQR